MKRSHQNLYQINTRLFLSDLSRRSGRRATLSDFPDEEIDRLAALGFDWVWMLGVWQTGEAGRRAAQENGLLRTELLSCLPDLGREDIVSSPFAVRECRVHDHFGGEEALATLRRKLECRGLRLMLDFVPNHVALDHPWVRQHPEYFVAGDAAKLAAEPMNYVRTEAGVLAHGRDPNFWGWSDTLQIDYSSAAAREAVMGTLERVAERCDGVRCDMAMLLLNDVFARTWPGRRPPREEFWPGAIQRVRSARPDFTFVAEVYWGLESALLAQGFDAVYDKVLYDGLLHMDPAGVWSHLRSKVGGHSGCVHFIENHDELRAAAAFAPDFLRVAAVVAGLAPGIFLVHEGQMEGRRVRAPMQLARRRQELPDGDVREFHERLLTATTRESVRHGRWEALPTAPAWEGNGTWRQFVAMHWAGVDGRMIVAANLGATQGQCLVTVPASYGGRTWALRDLLGPSVYERSGDEMSRRGLYLDMPAWRAHVFEAV